MDWYLYKNQVTQLNSRRLRLLCRMRHLLTNIRNVPHLVRDPHRLRLTFCSSLQTTSRRNYLKSQRSKKKTLSSTYSRLFGTATNDMEYGNGFQKFRFYSTSNRDTFKAEAPIGVYQNSNTFRLNLLGMRLGDSFNRLSSHINLYFKQKEVSVVDNGQEGFVCAVQEPISRMARQRTLRTLRERRSAENRAFIRGPATEQVQKDSSNQSQGMSLTSLYPNLQLFHISSLATRFGESYNYVANHINSVFSRSPAKQDHVDVSSNDAFRGSRSKKISSPHWETWQTQQSISVPSRTASADTDNNSVCSSWEEGYLHFARHINLYFGAKVEDTVKESSHHQRRPTDDHGTHMLKPSVSLDQPLLEKTNNPGSSLQPKSPGLFHMSNLTTRFGENYTYMANHINRYFKGSATLEEDDVGQGIYLEQYRGPPENTVTQEKPVSLLQCLVNPLTIPSLVGSYLGIGSSSHSDQTTTAPQAPEAMLYKPALGGRRTEDMTRVLLDRLQEAIVPSSITSCVEELNAHLIQHPACKAVVWQEKAAFQLLRRRRIFWMNDKLQEAIRETLALIGYADPVKGCGIRVLSIDGGGTKGIVPLQVLKQLEAQTGKRVYQLFDYICGVSTGAVLAFMLGLTRISLDECEEMYHRFGSDVFRQNPLVGTVKMGWTHSYYNSETWEMILREKMGEQILIETARYEMSPKVSAVSAVVNWGKSPKAFIFRNYNHAPGRISRYAGGSGYKMWQAVRASSAAPGYFQEFPLHGDIHQDGGLILNNPCALAVHESRLLWPNQPFQCVLSLGTGLYDNARRGPATSTSLRAKISNLICSATDTEGVHTLLEDLLEPDVYFRFNPMLSLDVTLDESRPGVLQQLQKDTQLYLDRNRLKMDGLCNVLRAERTAFWKTRDWISEKAWELQQRWA